MGQVPAAKAATYLIIGSGKLAKHISHYFDLLGIPYLNWFRKSDESLNSLIAKSEKILVLINDDEIENFISRNNNNNSGKFFIHCSGLLSTPLAESAHPLMTFSTELYDLTTYEQIPFITEKGRKSFIELFPEMRNSSFEIDPGLKPLYHAWCVMSGNFTTILWQRFFEIIEVQFGINKKYAIPYLNKISENLISDKFPLTGPLARGDNKVIEKNMLALKDEPFAEIYGAFVNAYNKMKEGREK